MATVRNVEKNLATMQDLAQGRGSVTQSRGGVNYDVNRIDVPFAVDNLTELKALDVTVYTRARVYFTDNRYYNYIYVPTETLGIVPNAGAGTWVPDEYFFNYEMFGADITGVAAADAVMKQCHDLANLYNKAFKQDFGTIYWQNTELTVKTCFDGRGMTIRLDTNSGTPGATYTNVKMYTIERKSTPVVLDSAELLQLNTTFASYFKKYSHAIPASIFDEYRGCAVRFTGDRDTLRFGALSGERLKQELCVLSRQGMMQHKLFKDYQGVLTEVKIYPKEDFRLYFFAPDILDEGSQSMDMIRCHRSNTEVVGGNFFEASTADTVAKIHRQMLITECADITVRDAEGICIQPNGQGGSYILGGGYVVNMKLKNLRGVGGWGFMGTNYIKNLKATGCNINRFDAHWGAADWYLDNNHTINAGIAVCGSGTIKITNHSHSETKNIPELDGEARNGAVLFIRGDYGGEWDGDIQLDNISVLFDDDRPLPFDFSVVNLTQGSDDYGRAMIRGKTITVNNVNFTIPEAMADDLETTSTLNIVNYGTQFNGLQDNYIAHTVNVDGAAVTNDKGKTRITAYKAPNYANQSFKGVFPGRGHDDTIIGNIRINVSNIHNAPLAEHSADDSKYLVVLNQGLPGSGVDPYYTDDNRLRFDINLDNCEGAELALSAIANVKMNNGSLFAMDDGTQSANLVGKQDINLSNVGIKLKSTTDVVGVGTYPLPDKVKVSGCTFFKTVNPDGSDYTAQLTAFVGRGNTLATGASGFWVNPTDAVTPDFLQLTGTVDPDSPFITPNFIGQKYFNTTDNILWEAVSLAAWTPINTIELSGTGDPTTVTPNYRNQFYRDTSDNSYWISYNTGTGQWIKLNNEGP